jgi:hypothetical protein
MERGRYKIEGSVQPTKTTCSAREESQNVGRDTQPAVAVLVSAGLRLGLWSLSYLIYPRPVNFVFIYRDWLVPLFPPLATTVVRDASFIFDKMSQTVKDLTAGTAGGMAQVKPLL